VTTVDPLVFFGKLGDVVSVKTEEENLLDDSRSEQHCLCPKSTEENDDLERVTRE
jgi:hypothetical protein